MQALADSVAAFLDQLQRENASPHTVRSYGSDLKQLVEYFSSAGEGPAVSQLDTLAIREWLGSLYRQKLSAVTLRRKLAAVRSFFRWLLREGAVEANAPGLVQTPKTPRTLPRIMTAEQVGNLLDGAASGKLERRNPTRDVAMLELLYGCGLRVSELVGLQLSDLDLEERWILVRGKGRKERQVPLGAKAFEALSGYLAVRSARKGQQAVFLNVRGGRLTDRGVRGIVKLYARELTGDDAVHPHSFRHAFATHLLADGADLRAIQELLGHARLSTTQKYTQVELTDLMATYDKAHPRAMAARAASGRPDPDQDPSR